MERRDTPKRGSRRWSGPYRSTTISSAVRVKTPGLKVVFGTDALAGAHGRNAEEFIDRVRDAGVDPMSAMVSANSLAAEAMRMGDRIGSIAPGYEADIIALDGDPLKDITAVRRVVFVMKGGNVFKAPPAGPRPAHPEEGQPSTTPISGSEGAAGASARPANGQAGQASPHS